MMEMRLVLARVFWRYDVSHARKLEEAEWTDQASYLLWERKPLLVRLAPVGLSGKEGVKD